jgi:hypothetical protein
VRSSHRTVRAGALLLSLASATPWASACSSPASPSADNDGGSASPTSCGAGTHDNGSNVCVVDNYLALVNPANTYWSCNFPGDRGSTQAFVFVESTSTTGTGTFAPFTSTSLSQLESFTWTATATDAIAMTLTTGTSLAPFMNLTAIVPNFNNTSFSTGELTTCTLTAGAIGPQASTVMTR